MNAALAIDPAAIWIAATSIAIIFAASAALKLADLEQFRGALVNYRILPEPIAIAIAPIVPVAELAAAVAIALPQTRALGTALTVALLIAFTAAIAANLIRGRRHVDCGCFGAALRQELSWWLVARNAALAVVAVVAADAGDGRVLARFDIVTIGFGAASIVLLYAAANYLLANAPAMRALVTQDA
jgi:hypothetical protein